VDPAAQALKTAFEPEHRRAHLGFPAIEIEVDSFRERAGGCLGTDLTNRRAGDIKPGTPSLSTGIEGLA
jgi:hypothetical protein